VDQPSPEPSTKSQTQLSPSTSARSILTLAGCPKALKIAAARKLSGRMVVMGQYLQISRNLQIKIFDA
jgi:hypothetical protein